MPYIFAIFMSVFRKLFCSQPAWIIAAHSRWLRMSVSLYQESEEMSWSLTYCITMRRVSVAVNTEGENQELRVRGRRNSPSPDRFFHLLSHDIRSLTGSCVVTPMLKCCRSCRLALCVDITIPVGSPCHCDSVVMGGFNIPMQTFSL